MSAELDPRRQSLLEERDELRRRVEQLTRDLTQSRSAEQSARELVEKRSQWIMRLAHDLRNPISGIRGAAEATLQTMLTVDQRRDLEIVRRAADGVLDMVNDLMQLPQRSGAVQDIEHLEFDVQDLLADVILTSTPAARAKGLSLVSHLSHDVPASLIADPLKLRRILTNLVGNAIKFTDQGEVLVRVSFGTDEKLSGHLHLVVEDTGRGVADEHQSEIFDAFRQVCPTGGAEGVGLGLSICMELTRLLSGQIWVESELGSGSRFHVKIPVTTPTHVTARQDTTKRPYKRSSLCSLRILLAEDCEVNQIVLAGLLGSFGHAVDIVTTGREAIAAARNESYDAVLMDLEMPEADGIQATRALRSRPDPTLHHLPIIGMTAHVDPRVTRRCLNAGMDACLSKPLDPEQLARMLEKLTRRRRPLSPSAEVSWDGPHDERSGDHAPTNSKPTAPSAQSGWLRVDNKD